MSVRHDTDLLEVLVIHLRQDVDADLLTVEDFTKLLKAQAEKQMKMNFSLHGWTLKSQLCQNIYYIIRSM